jgi:hypothetical protein
MKNTRYSEFAISAADRCVDRAILAALFGQSDQVASLINSGNLAIMAAKRSLSEHDKKTALILNRQIARISADLSRLEGA